MAYNAFNTGLLVSVTTISYLLVQPLAGWLADKMNPIIILRLGMLVSCITSAAIPFIEHTLLIIVCILSGISVGTVWTNSDALVSKLSGEKEMGATMGVAGSFKEFGDMIGPLLMGAISQIFGLSIGFVSCAILGMIALAVTVFASSKNIPKEL